MVGAETFETIMEYVRFVWWVYKTHPSILAEYYKEQRQNEQE